MMGKLVIISGPSGSGKSTVLRRLGECCWLPLQPSVSATTRPPRPGERDGQDYHFLSPEEFHRRREAGEFLECKEVFGAGYWYGTLRREVEAGLADGKSVILEIDVQGGLAVLEQCPRAVTIFVDPGSRAELERRLRARGTDSEEAIGRRLATAEEEFRIGENHYRHRVINDTVDRAVQEICEILQAEVGGTNGCMKN